MTEGRKRNKKFKVGDRVRVKGIKTRESFFIEECNRFAGAQGTVISVLEVYGRVDTVMVKLPYDENPKETINLYFDSTDLKNI